MNKKNIWYKHVCLLCMVIPALLAGKRLHEYQVEGQKRSDVRGMIEAAVQVQADELQNCLSHMDGEGLSSDAAASWLDDRDMVDMEALRRENPDVHGILRIHGTSIDDPVMDTEDRDKYLYRDFYGEESVYGSLFMDRISRYDWGNTLIFGHHMRNGAMFGELERYSDEIYRDAHSVMKYITEERIEIYEVLAAFSLDISQTDILEALSLEQRSQMEVLAEAISQNGGMLYGEFCEGAKYLSLVTCEYTREDGRYIVIGKKIGEVQRSRCAKERGRDL